MVRRAMEVTQVWTHLFPRFQSSSVKVQGQVREMIVHSILSGLVPPGTAVPPSRTLALALGVSRNTVSLALQSLVGKGFLVAVPRSGLYVNDDIVLGQAGTNDDAQALTFKLDWSERLKGAGLASQRNISKPSNWQAYPFPFIYGQFDASLMPLRDWRTCTNQSLMAPAVRQWSQDLIDGDSSLLIDQIQHRLLPARGIVAERNEIMVTAGAQMATYLLSQVLLGRDTIVGIEDPGYPDARNSFLMRTEQVRPLAIDDQGMRPGRNFSSCDYVFVTPSHQCPTTVTMPLERRLALLRLARRRDVVLFEDDHESELNFSAKPLPALKSLDTDNRVIYIGSLSKTLAHSLRLGFVVGPADLIRELRRLRRLVIRHAPNNNAHTTALFVSQGYHESFMRKLNTVYRARRNQLETSLQAHLPMLRVTPSLGGSAAWIEGPRGLDSRRLSQVALQHGVIIEPGGIFFHRPTAAQHRWFRMGYSAITEGQIDEGVLKLRAAMTS